MKETELKGKTVCKCEKCGLLYKNKNAAEKCEDWCTKNNSCNLEITKNAIKIKTGGKK